MSRLFKLPTFRISPQRFYSKDRPYSTALGIIPTIQEHDEYVEKNTRISSDVRPYSEIPGPKGLPLLGNSWRFAPIIGHYKIDELDKVMWSLFKDYGRIVKVGGLIGHPDLLFVFNGDDIRKVFKREERMPHRPSMPSLHYYKQHLKKDFFQDNPGVIGVHGPKWEQFRKQVQHILLQPQIARTYVTPLDQIAGDFIARMEEMLDNRKELPDNFLSEIYKWALESVAMVSLDTRLGCLQSNLNENSEPQQIINSINTFFWNVAKVELKMPIWRVYKNKAFRDYIGALEDFRMLCLKHINNTMEIMRKRNNKNENISIVERILLKTDDPKLAAILALDLLLVGVDTTSIATASTIYQLTQNQDKQEILYEDLRKLLPTPESPINNEILEKTTYLKACIRETLRLYPVIIGNGRSLQSDMIIGGYNVPKGTHVIFPHLVVSHSHEYFDKPEKFLPERWLNNDGIECPKHNRIHPFVSLPFGYGRRSCLGRRFAEMELQIFLAKLFRKYKIEYHYQPLTYKITPTYVPEQPLKFRLIERK